MNILISLYLEENPKGRGVIQNLFRTGDSYNISNIEKIILEEFKKYGVFLRANQLYKEYLSKSLSLIDGFNKEEVKKFFVDFINFLIKDSV